MNKKQSYLLISLLSYTVNSFALELQGGKNIPIELNLIIGQLNYYQEDLTEKQLPTLKSIDFLSQQLHRDIFFINTKLEIYKSLLKNDKPSSKNRIDGSSLLRMKTAISKSNDEFMIWFLKALSIDITNLINSSEYKEYLLVHPSSTITSSNKIEHRRIEKKMQLLNYWIEKINPDSDEFPENLKKTLANKLINILKNINNTLKFIARESKLKFTAPIDWKFKSLSEVAPSSAKILPISPNKSVEDILAPVTGDASSDLPPPIKEKWLEDENLPNSLKNLPKPTNDASWLEDF